MTRQPTQTEIQQAEELQRLGLCHGAKRWIYKLVWQCGKEEIIVERKGYTNVACEKTLPIGPLPTASECYLEMDKIVMPHKITSEGTAYIFELVAKHMHCGDVDQAFRQALIELANEEICQNG